MEQEKDAAVPGGLGSGTLLPPLLVSRGVNSSLLMSRGETSSTSCKRVSASREVCSCRGVLGHTWLLSVCCFLHA